MPIRTAPDHPRYDASVQRSAKNAHDRDPLLIPQPFADARPWYRRRSGQVLAVLLVLCLGVAGLVVFKFGVKDTVEGVGRFGSRLLRAFASIAGG
jgi:hypothetical protein